jgi:hypothetical protein
MNKHRIINTTIGLLLMGLGFTAIEACGAYSFSGVTIDYDKVKTISIEDFYNDADGGPPNLGQVFSNKLRDYYLQNTNLRLVREGGDLQLTGAVTGYRLTPVAPQAARSDLQVDAAALTRLTLTVQADFMNLHDDTYDFKRKTFSFYTDFDNNESLATVETRLVETIFDQIVLDIFNASVANW